jgi:hypothetical protein
MVCSCGVDAVLIAHDFPELGTNLVTALTALNVQDLPHGCCSKLLPEQGGARRRRRLGKERRLQNQKCVFLKTKFEIRCEKKLVLHFLKIAGEVSNHGIEAQPRLAWVVASPKRESSEQIGYRSKRYSVDSPLTANNTIIADQSRILTFDEYEDRVLLERS